MRVLHEHLQPPHVGKDNTYRTIQYLLAVKSFHVKENKEWERQERVTYKSDGS